MTKGWIFLQSFRLIGRGGIIYGKFANFLSEELEFLNSTLGELIQDDPTKSSGISTTH
jgi:hypothetical protein